MKTLKNRQVAVTGIEMNTNQEIHPNRHPMAPSHACAMVIQDVGILSKVRQFNQLTNTHHEATTEKPGSTKTSSEQKIHLPKRLPVKKKTGLSCGCWRSSFHDMFPRQVAWEARETMAKKHGTCFFWWCSKVVRTNFRGSLQMVSVCPGNKLPSLRSNVQNTFFQNDSHVFYIRISWW